MLKLILFLALVLNIFLIVSSGDTTSKGHNSASDHESEVNSASADGNNANKRSLPRKPKQSCGDDPNAIPGCGSACARRCLDSDESINDRACIQVCLPCECKPGYIIDDNTGKCVLPENCPKFKCNANETYVQCPDHYCGPQTCDKLGFPLSSCVVDQIACASEPACFCKSGFLRDESGNCISSNECPSCGGDPNAQLGCGNLCTKRCSDSDDNARICPLIYCLHNACTCKPGYVIDDNTGKCILPEQCPPQCGKHEVYSECTNGGCYGARKCTEIGKKDVICVKRDPSTCKKGCVCEEGFFRNSDGICVPPNQCDNNLPTCKNPNEEYDVCPATCPPRECGVDPATVLCLWNPEVGDPECEPGCKCCEGYLRNSDGICVPKDECPEKKVPRCGMNEEYSSCVNGGCFNARNCTELGRDGIICVDPIKCVEGCLCKDGFYRNSKDVCVPPNQCDNDSQKCTGPNEVFGCGSACDTECATLGQTCPIINIKCNDKCYCKDGYARNSNNTCVPINECPAPQCGKNEVYSECTNGGCYGARKCTEIGKKDVICVKRDPSTCKKGCVCEEGFFRNSDGICVPPNQCDNNLPTCENPNEEYDVCPATCPPKECGVDPATILCLRNPEVGDPECEPGCKCCEGYLRNSDGICVPKDECPEKEVPRCGMNEEYSSCVNGGCFNARNCTELGRDEIICVDRIKCVEGCLCKEGFYRNSKDVCVPPNQCDNDSQKCTGPNEVFGCGSACDTECATLGQTCPIINIKCNDKCYCKDGYARNSNNTCVPINECPANCADGGFINFCPPQPCDAENCPLTRDSPTSCVSTKQCGKPRCICGFNQKRDSKTGKCISTRNCPPFECDKPNEEYQSCPPVCPGETCTDHLNNATCPKYRIGIVVPCKPQCRCKKGFYRDYEGFCVKGTECKKEQCTGPNEFFSCGQECDNECGNPNQNRTKCPIMNIKCYEKCYCKDGFSRNSDGTCIPNDECPEKCTGPNEVFECGSACDTECATLGQTCPIINKKCNDKCYCKDGYARNSNNTCVPINECPANCADGGFINLCPPQPCDAENCPLTRDSPTSCVSTKQCGKPRCICGFNQKRDSKTGKCISTRNCPPFECDKPNEEYQSCPPVCPGETCTDYLNNATCPKYRIGIVVPCKPQCRCKKGFYRDYEGFCVKGTECKKEQCTGPNEFFSCGQECDNECGNPNQNRTKCPIMNIKCYEKCYCKDGFSRNSDGTCIPNDECPAKLKCNADETYVECPDKSCNPQTCDQLGFPQQCSLHDANTTCSSKPACLCNDGLVRDKNGICVPSNECPSCGGDPNAGPGCGNFCTKRCSDSDDKPKACPAVCQSNGCTCKQGYVVDDNTGKCILPEQCPKLKCNANETYVECPDQSCNPQTCDQLGFPQQCSLQDTNTTCSSEPACLCNNGFVRDKNGICIPSNECPSCGGDPNAGPGCGNFCTKRCSDSDDKPKACSAVCQLNGCTCKQGYVVDDNTGKCILPEQCPKLKCSPNETYVECPDQSCSPQTCDQLGSSQQCALPDANSTCSCSSEPACLCKDGFVRDKNGICMPLNECRSCGGDPNAKPGCGKQCVRRCLDTVDRPKRCPFICRLNDCTCKPGYVVDDNTGKCILPEQCPKLKCNANETYVECPDQSCNPKTCDQLGFPQQCSVHDANTTCSSEPACLCNDGFVRDKNGICISSDECPSCGGDPNAQVGCGKLCVKRCSDPEVKLRICPKILCRFNDCTCKPGYVVDDNTGKCILPEQCPKLQCNANETYVECPDHSCKPQTCDQIGFPKECALPDANTTCSSQPACLCNDGFVRDKNGICIPSNECPSCGGDPNALPGCGNLCTKRCSDSGDKPRICPLICLANACTCKPGYVIDDNTGKCILPEQCPKIKCNANETYVKCPDQSCKPQTCDQLGFPLPCELPDANSTCSGEPACHCNDGFVRDKNGICIPSNECPSCGGDPNSQPGCGNLCTKRCSDPDDKPKICPRICQFNACTCKPGYVIDDNTGKCILPEQCQSCGGDPNAMPGCGNACVSTCYKRVNNKLCTRECPRPCICKPGYIVDDNTGKCVLPENCPKLKCNANETYVECPDYGCNPQTCDQIGFPQNCAVPYEGSKYCSEPACLCKNGFVRDDNGVCRPQGECNSCGGDPNSRPGCGNLCTKRCSDINDKPRPCPLVCQLNACTCKPGYVIDDSTGKCILPEQCPPLVCGKNEVYSDCTNGGCYGARKCTEIGGTDTICVKRDPKSCTKGCLCKEGYYRNSNGICVPKNQCDNNLPTCNNPNEEYDVCPSFCPGDKCGIDPRLVRCAQYPKVGDPECEPRCRCSDGYLRNSDGFCVPIDDCPKEDNCSNGGTINTCPPEPCDAEKCPLSRDSPTSCKSTKNCGKPRCTCGFNQKIHRKTGKCISIRDCPPFECDKRNEEYQSCPPVCPGETCTDYLNNATCPKYKIGIVVPCKPQCRCKKGFYRDYRGFCVKGEECKKVACPDGGFFNTCPAQACDADNCPLTRDSPTACPSTRNCGEPRCTCGFNQKRNRETGKCVDITDCPPFECDRPNEIYHSCPSRCPGQTCESYINNPYTTCPKDEHTGITVPCQQQCICKHGYYRNDQQICIKGEECIKDPVCTGQNEEFSTCSQSLCRAQNCSQLGTSVPCIRLDPRYCNRACVCKEGYLKNEKGICVPEKECKHKSKPKPHKKG